MRLVQAECVGYKRFRDRQTIRLDPKLVCIVGPNAAGKSSFLDALVHLNRDDEFGRAERTRGIPQEEPTEVRAYFELDDGDREALRGIPEAANAQRLILWKRLDHGRGLHLEPVPKRDISSRAEVRSRLKELGTHPWTGRISSLEQSEGVEQRVDQLLDEAISALSSEREQLDASEADVLEDLARRLEEQRVPHRYRSLPGRLRTLAGEDRTPPPLARALGVLGKRLPAFVKFDDNARNLAAAYDLNGGPDVAISNLLQLAGTNWAAAVDIYRSEDPGRKITWLDDTRERLSGAITAAWGASDLAVRFDIDENILNVVMSMQSNDYIGIDQHSDGLRQFVALRALIAVRGYSAKPVILIDEAETHLHYDAQADLTGVLEDQEESAKVIYTTHSAGCLPRDLGLGIRAIVPIYRDEQGQRIQTDHSEIVNNFWVHGSDFSPLLLAMGASAFAFAATQRALVTEGISDALLLPTLIREAANEERLAYQVVPGFSEASSADVPQFDLLAARVAFCADGDQGGRDHAKKLMRNGVRRQQIAYLGGRRSDLSLEDLLVKSVYVEAVNEVLEQAYPGVVNARIAEADVPDKGRSRAVASLLETRKDGAGNPLSLSKPAVAQRLLDKRPRGLVAPRKRSTLRTFHENVKAIFGEATHRL